MFASFAVAVHACGQGGAFAEHDEVMWIALFQQGVNGGILLGFRGVGGKFGLREGDVFLFEHRRQIRHAFRSFGVACGYGVDEFGVFQRLEHVHVPLAADKHGGSEQFGFGYIQVKRNHAAH